MGQAAYPGSVAVFAILFDVEHEAFEVFAFRVVNADRVVGGLRHLVQDAYVAACDGCGREDRRAEQFLQFSYMFIWQCNHYIFHIWIVQIEPCWNIIDFINNQY